MKKYLIAGNWKMNLTVDQSIEFTRKLISALKKIEKNRTVMIAPPFTSLYTISNLIKGSEIILGAQNINDNSSGAYTGEISADMLKNCGVSYVIIGHSERRHIYGEDDSLINKKILFSLKNDLFPILCVGETISEREANKVELVIDTQITNGLKDVTPENMAKLVIAYEPVWAIGTGKTATPEIAQQVHSFIRKKVESLYGKSVSDNLIIQYGGSVKDNNVDELMAMPDINGALVGGASLQLESFERIVRFK